jgi:hypothetical protein
LGASFGACAFSETQNSSNPIITTRRRVIQFLQAIFSL